MPRRTLAKVVESIILVQELPMKWKNMAKYCQKYYDNDEFDDFDNEDEHHGKKTKNKSKKIDFDIVRKCIVKIVLMKVISEKECKLLMEFLYDLQGK
jgi:hypothetical protein